MDIFSLLKQDHEVVANIFKKLELKDHSPETAESLFGELKTELELHSQVEESVFYPALKNAQETREITLEALKEHKAVARLLEELDAEPTDQEGWAAKLTELRENVEHHVKEEEEEMFPKAKKVLTKDQTEEMGVRMESKKKEIRAQSGMKRAS